MKAFACFNTNEDIRMKSSSGGIFSALALQVLNADGVVYGVAMSEDCYSAEYIRVVDEQVLEKLRGSKYLQAKLGDTFVLVKKDLEEGKKVLFSGTGCQVNGLKKFLQKDYDNLYCIDIVCHGTPSPELWKKYVRHQESKYGKLLKVNFRCKDDSLTNLGMKEKMIFIPKSSDAYMQIFLRDYGLRPSCYKCVAKDVKMSDVTIGDFWGIENVAPKMNDNKGTSLAIVRTDKGKKIFLNIKDEMEVKMVSYEDAVRGNPCEFVSVKRPNERESFFCDMNSMDFEELAKKYAAPISQSFKVKCKRYVKQLLQNLHIIKVVRKFWQSYGLMLIFLKEKGDNF